MDKTLATRLQQSDKQLFEVALHFLEGLSPSDLSEKKFRSLVSLLNQRGIIALSRQLRSELATSLREISRCQRYSVWELIDNIGFWEDAHPGRWRYTTLADSHRYLQWVEEFFISCFWQRHVDQAYHNAYQPSDLPWSFPSADSASNGQCNSSKGQTSQISN